MGEITTTTAKLVGGKIVGGELDTIITPSRIMGAVGLPAMYSAADLSHKFISELLQLCREAHSLVSLTEVVLVWDSKLAFTLNM